MRKFGVLMGLGAALLLCLGATAQEPGADGGASKSRFQRGRSRVSAVSPIGIAGAEATIALDAKTPKIKTKNRPIRIAADLNGEKLVLGIGAVDRPLLPPLAAAAGASDRPASGLGVDRAPQLLQPHVMAISVGDRVLHLLPLLVKATGVAPLVRPLLRDVPRIDAKDRERGEAICRLVPVADLDGTRVPNATRKHRLGRRLREQKSDALRAKHEDRNGLPLHARQIDLLPAGLAVGFPGAVRAVVEIGAGRRTAKRRRHGVRLPSARPRAVEIGARRREDTSHRERLAGMDILASVVAVRMAGAAPLIAVPRMDAAMDSAAVDALAARSTAQEDAAISAGAPEVIVADTSVSAKPIAAPRIGAVADTELISALAVTADAVTARLTAVVDAVALTLSVVVVAADSVLTAPPRMVVAPPRVVGPRLPSRASARQVMDVELSAIRVVAVLLASAMPDTAVAVGVDTLVRDSQAVDNNRMVVGAVSPASIAGRVGVASPLLITCLPGVDGVSPAIAAKVSCAEL